MAEVWRDEVWKGLARPVGPHIVIGGGITGAGILRESSRMGYRALLVEQGDFASGHIQPFLQTRHGGLRYIKEGSSTSPTPPSASASDLLVEAPASWSPLNSSCRLPRRQTQADHSRLSA